MPGDVRVQGRGNTAAGSDNPVESGKFSSILAYLDDVSERTLRTKSVTSPRALQHHFDASSLSNSSWETQERRNTLESRSRQHTQEQRKSCQGGGELKLEGEENRPRGTRAPWDSSTKKAATSTQNKRGLTTSSERGDAGGEEGRMSAARASQTMTSTLATTGGVKNSRRNQDISHHRLAGVDTADRHGVADGGGGSSYPAGDSSDEALDHSTKGAGDSPAVRGERRRWVWDEWDADISLLDNGISSARNWQSSSPAANRPRASESLTSAAHTADATAVASGKSATADRRKKPTTGNDGALDTCTPAARQAFEDVQATARAMREDLKKRRFEVLELKTSLQRVRASNERRRAKLSERWASRVEAAEIEKKEAAERQRAFGRQLEKDVGALEEKLGGLERQVGRLRDGRERDRAMARAECARELKKAREAWMSAEKGRLQRMSEKKAGAIKHAAVRALEPQLSELVKSNRAEARARMEELEATLLGQQATLERESADKVQADARDYQASLEAEVEEERHQAEHQLRVLARSNEAECHEFREATRRDLEGERVRFEASRKRAREAASKEVEAARAAEADRAAITLAEHARELRETEEAYRQEEEDTRQRLAQETERGQRKILASARKEAEEWHESKKRQGREKCNEELDMVLTRLEAEATQAREATRADAQQLATAAADARGQELAAAQELETRAMERYLDSARRQAELEAETKGLEQEIKTAEDQIQEEMERLATAERQDKEGSERWRSRLQRIQEECCGERQSARDEVSRLSNRSEEAEQAAQRATREAEEESASLKAALSDEFAQVEAKIEAVLNKKTEQAEALKERLSTLRAQTKAREEELSDHRRRTFS